MVILKVQNVLTRGHETKTLVHTCILLYELQLIKAESAELQKQYYRALYEKYLNFLHRGKKGIDDPKSWRYWRDDEYVPYLSKSNENGEVEFLIGAGTCMDSLMEERN